MLLRSVPLGNPIISHEELLPLQPIFLIKRFDNFLYVGLLRLLTDGLTVFVSVMTVLHNLSRSQMSVVGVVKN